jgi:hypothetical protein
MVPTFPVDENAPKPVEMEDNVTGLSEYAVTLLENAVFGLDTPKSVAVTQVGGSGLLAFP